MSFILDQFPDLSEIKGLIKELTRYEVVSERTLADMDKALSEKMEEFSISMFIRRKAENKSFTIRKETMLRKIQIDEETGSLTEEDSLQAAQFFRNNIEAFHELVAQCFVSKTAKDFLTDNQIFYAVCQSKYCKELIHFYFINKCGQFEVLVDESSRIDLQVFISDYLGPIDKDIELLIDKLKTEKTLSHKELQIRIFDIFTQLSKSIGESPEFVEGAITFFDFLGWKGLWQNSSTKPLQAVAELIEVYKEKIRTLTTQAFPIVPVNVEMSTLISISDTIAIFTPKVSGVSECDLLSLHADIARFILETSCERGYPIRGAISYGRYSVINNVMIGPGIDECASWHEKCDWIGAHLTPSAQFRLELQGKSIPANILQGYCIPTKSGIPKLKFCIKWDISFIAFDAMCQKVKAILPEIAAKYLNTYDFLIHVRGGD